MSAKQNILNALADSDLDCAEWTDRTLNKLASIVLNALIDLTDEELLIPGEPYRVEKAIHVPKDEGIQLRREAWNKIVRHIIMEPF